ncbi:MAG: YdjY domain-containing protein [Pirellulaceae bacterium]
MARLPSSKTAAWPVGWVSAQQQVANLIADHFDARDYHLLHNRDFTFLTIESRLMAAKVPMLPYTGKTFLARTRFSSQFRLFRPLMLFVALVWVAGSPVRSVAQDAAKPQKPALPKVDSPLAEPSPTSKPPTSKAPTSKLGQALAETQAKRDAGEEPEKTAVDEYLENYIGNEDIARVSFLAPPGATSISKKNNLWVDRKSKFVYADGYVAMREAGLEMFACPVGTKEHESVVATLAKAKEVHAALLAIGAKPGSPAKFLPEFVPAKGQIIRVWVCWRDEAGKFQVTDARRWVQKQATETEHMSAEWVFSGSGFWKDPADGHEYYRADGGDMICVSNFTTAMLDVNTASSAEAEQLQYFPFTDRIPPRGTPIRLVLTPLEDAAGDKNGAGKQAAPPTEMVLPVNPKGSELRKQKIANEEAIRSGE